MFSLVLRHINHCRLLMPNPLSIDISKNVKLVTLVEGDQKGRVFANGPGDQRL